jgi:hypothetical protein
MTKLSDGLETSSLHVFFTCIVLPWPLLCHPLLEELLRYCKYRRDPHAASPDDASNFLVLLKKFKNANLKPLI